MNLGTLIHLLQKSPCNLEISKNIMYLFTVLSLKQVRSSFLYLMIIFCLFINTVSAQNGVSTSIETGLFSNYIYKGIIYSDKMVYQAGITGSYSEYSAGIWGNFNSPQYGRKNELTELDIFVSRSFSIGDLLLNNTASVYFFYGEDPYPVTAEYILYASYPVEPVTFFSDLSLDIAEYAGAFMVTHGLNYEQPLTSVLYFNSSLSFSWATGRYNYPNTGFDKSAIIYAGIDLSLAYYHNSGFYIRPQFQYNVIPDKRLHEYIGKFNTFYGLLAGFTI